jgi:hypothetical protein
MKLGEMFPSKSLKADDFKDNPQVLTMADVEIVTFDDGTKKPALSFQEHEKRLLLNRTNSNIIAESYGDDTDAWRGKRIQLYAARVEFKGDIVDAIRVQGPKQNAAPPPPSGFDDEPPEPESGDPGANDPGNW